MVFIPQFYNYITLGLVAVSGSVMLYKSRKYRKERRITFLISLLCFFASVLFCGTITTVEEKKEIKKDNLLTSENKVLKDSVVILHYEVKTRDGKISELRSQINDVEGYPYFSTLNYFAYSEPSNVPSAIGGLAKKMSKIFCNTPQGMALRTSDSILGLINDLITDYPKYPFPYYAKYMYLKESGKQDWQPYAEEALDIFKITTTLKGHDKSHDDYMKRVMADLDIKDNDDDGNPVVDFNYADDVPKLLIHNYGSLDSVIFRVEMANRTAHTAKITSEEAVFIAATKKRWIFQRKYITPAATPRVLTSQKWVGTQYSFLIGQDNVSDVNYIYVKVLYNNEKGVSQKPFTKLYKYNPRYSFNDQVRLNEIYPVNSKQIRDTLRSESLL